MKDMQDHSHEAATWNRKVSIPQRSKLYNLEPCGNGGEHRESLPSYIVRLADAHGVPPVDLFTDAIVPLFVKVTKSSLKGKGRIRAMIKSEEVINDYLETAKWLYSGYKIQKLLNALQELTLRSDLRKLIRINSRRQQKMYRPCRAWCPDCYLQQKKENAAVYDMLDWMMVSTDYCIIHDFPLRWRCPNCNRKSAPISSFAKPGHCYICGCWLGQFAREEY